MTNAVVAVTLSRWAASKVDRRYLLHLDACPDLHLYSDTITDTITELR